MEPARIQVAPSPAGAGSLPDESEPLEERAGPGPLRIVAKEAEHEHRHLVDEIEPVPFEALERSGELPGAILPALAVGLIELKREPG